MMKFGTTTKGLAVKNQLKENEAMLLVFEESAKHSFWMKDMKFPIDILWLDSDGKVVNIEHNLQPFVSIFIHNRGNRNAQDPEQKR